MNVIKIEVTGASFRRECVLCGDTTNKEPILAVLDQGNERREDAVCDACVDAGPESIAARLLEYAEALERRAAALRQIAEEPFEMPSLEALNHVRQLEYEARATGTWPEMGAF